MNKENNTLKLENEQLKHIIEEKLYEEFFNKLLESKENERLKKENKRLRLQVKKLREDLLRK